MNTQQILKRFLPQRDANGGTSTRQKRGEQFLLHHAFTLILCTVLIFFVVFMIFFYQTFYRAITGKSKAEMVVTNTEKTINLGVYDKDVEVHSRKVDTGLDYADGSKTIQNPFVSR